VSACAAVIEAIADELPKRDADVIESPRRPEMPENNAERSDGH
jgi:hypothetical protein